MEALGRLGVESLMHEDLISIIVPVYNVADYLKPCLESLLGQTYLNLEIILVDDGSSDQSGKICDQYEKKDNRIVVVHQKNGGVSAARNKGMKIAKGKYIAFCDGDDWVEPDMYEYLYTLLKKSACKIASCGAWFGENPVGYAKQEMMILDTEEALVQLHLRNHSNDWLWTKMFDKNILDGLLFDTELKVSEDYAFECEAYKKCERIVCGSQVKYHYVQRKTSVSNNGYSIEFEKGLDVRKRYLDEFVAKYPDRAKELNSRYMLESMGVITAMIKGNYYDWTRIRQLQKEIRKGLWDYLCVRGPELYLKVSAIVICVNVRLFGVIYRNLKKFE